MSENSAANSIKKTDLDPLVAFGLIGVLLFFVISGTLAYVNLHTLREDTQKLSRSQDVITALTRILSSAQDAETGQRGFLLTNDPRYLQPYTAATQAIPARIAEITRLTDDNPLQQARIAQLKTHVAGKLAELRETIELRRTRGLDPALAVVNTNRGKIEMDAVRAQLAAMGEEIRVARQAARRDEQRVRDRPGERRVIWRGRDYSDSNRRLFDSKSGDYSTA